MSYTVTKSYATDFGSDLSVGQFKLCLNTDPVFVTNVDRVVLELDVVEIVFASTPSGAELTALDSKIANNVTLPEPLELAPNYWDATTDPGPADDETQGWQRGSKWYNVNTNIERTCHDATAGAADWDQTLIDHVSDLTLHRTIDDNATGPNDLLSASKIITLVGTKAASAHVHDATDVTTGTFSNGRISQSNVTQHESTINHDALAGFVADEHVAHSSVSVVAGTGLSGGGTIAASRTLDLDINGLVADATPVAGTDYVATYDASAVTAKKVLLSNLPVNTHVHDAADMTTGTLADARVAASNVTQHEAAINHDNLTGMVLAEHVDHTSVSITAGLGLSGGGAIDATRTLDLDIAGLVADASPVAGTDYVATYDASASTVKKVLLNNLPVNSHSHTAADVTDFDAAADARISVQAGANSGLATLDGGGKVPTAQLPFSGVAYQGTWNATTNTPTLVSSTGTQGHYYVVSVTGTTSIDGQSSWAVGDWIVFNGTIWEKADHTADVSSVAGKTGAVVLDAVDIVSGTLANARISAGSVTQHQAVINHDSLAGFVANEHVDHSTVSVTAGTGLSGGGTIDATRTLDLDINGLTTEAGASVGDYVPIYDVSATAQRKVLLSNLPVNTHTHTAAEIASGTLADARVAATNVTQHEAAINHDALLNFVANEHIDHSTVSIGAGVGLSGGGFIDASRTLNINIPGLTADATPDRLADYIVTYDDSAGQHKKVLLKDASESSFEAIVDATGSGDYLTVGAAFTAGKASVFVRNGMYMETSDIVVPSFGQLCGESMGGVILNFNGGTYSVKMDATGGTKYTTGTLGITSGTAIVTGAGGTLWLANVAVGQYVLLCGNYFKILTVDSDTQLTIEEVYEGITLTGQTYEIHAMLAGIRIYNLIVFNSATAGMYGRGLRNSTIQNVAIKNCAPNFQFIDCFSTGLLNGASENSTGAGISASNCVNTWINGIAVTNCSADGIAITDSSRNVNIANCIGNCNGANGLNILSSSSLINVTGCVFDSNKSKGMNSDPNTGSCKVVGSTFSNNYTGVDFDGSDHTMAGCIIKNNVDHGIWAGGLGVISGNKIVGNGNAGLHMNVDHDCTVTGNVVSGNAGDGIYCDSYKNVFIGNRVLSNGGRGLHLTATSNDNLVEGNILTGNTGADYDDLGTDNLVTSAHGHAAADITSGTFADARIAASNVTQHEATISHDALTGYVANQHVDHSTVSITAGAGLSGGGTIAATRTINLDIDGLTADATPAAGTDYVATYDASATTSKKVLLSNLPVNSHAHAAADVTTGTFADARVASSNVTQHEALINHDALTGFVTDEHVDHSTVSVTAGVGLSGGGTIAATRTIDLDVASLAIDGAPDVNADYVLAYDVSGTSHKRVLMSNLPTGGNNPGAGGNQHVVQARRTTTLQVSSGTYTSVSFNTTDLQTNSTVLEHDSGNLTRLVLKEDGPVLVYYHAVMDFNTADIVSAHVRANGTTVISGSYQKTSTKTNNSFGDLDNTFVYVGLANDYIELQVRNDAGTFNSQVDFIYGAVRLSGAHGMCWKGQWVTSTSYEATHVTHNNGNSYYCKVNHTASSTDEPGVGVNWTDKWDILVDASLHSHSASDITSGTLADARIAASNVTQHEAAINHDALTGFVADEHVAHSSVSVTAGVGLSGGGTIAATRTLNLDINGLTSESAPDAAADYVAVYDSSVTAIRKMLLGDLLIYGSQRHYAEEELEAITNSVSNVEVVSFTTSSLPNGTYRIDYGAECSSTGGGIISVIVDVNGTVIASFSLENDNDWPALGDRREMVLSGVKTVTMNFKVSVGTEQAKIRRARIGLIRVA